MHSRANYVAVRNGHSETPRWKSSKKLKQSSSYNGIARNTKMDIQVSKKKTVCKNEKTFRLWLIPLTPLLFVVLVTSSLG